MGIDTSTGGDSSPDRGAEAGDKPFPGAPENREPVAEPTNSRTLDDISAAHEKAGSLEEFNAIEKETAPGADSSGSGPGSVGDGTATAVGAREGTVPGAGVQGEGAEGTSVPGTDASGDRQTEDSGAKQPEGFLRPDSELPRFPGASENREPVEEPTNSRNLDDIRAAHEKANSYEEFVAIEKETAPSAKETSAAKPGSEAVAARDATSREPTKDESGEQQGEETDSGSSEETTPEQPVVRMPQQEMPAAEAPEGEHAPVDGGQPGTVTDGQQDVRHDGVVVLDQGGDAKTDPAPEGIELAKDGVVATRSDATTPEADDRPTVEGSVEPQQPEAGLSPEERETGDTNASRSEVRLDTQSDDQRPVTRAEMMAMVAEMKAEMAAENDAKLDAMEARHETEKAGLEQKVSELEAKLESALSKTQVESDRSPNDDKQHEPSSGHDAIGRGEWSEAPGPRDETEMADRAVVRQRGDVGELRDENLATATTDRPDFKSAGKDALSLAGAVGIVPSPLSIVLAGDSAHRSFEKMSPEDQYSTITTLDSLVNAFGSMSPETAVVATTASIFGPAVGAKARELLHKMRRKD